MKTRYFIPLIGFLVSNIIIGYGFVLPRNGLAGVNEPSVGFATTLLFASITYLVGIRQSLHDHDKR